jgi:hypothetical protein
MTQVAESTQPKSSVHREQTARDQHGLWHIVHIVAVVLTPLALLLVTIVATLVCIAFVRNLTAADGFLVQQQYAMLVVFIGLILAAATYTTSIIVAFKKINKWHETNKTKKAIGATWGLGMTAIIVSLPILLGAFIH